MYAPFPHRSAHLDEFRSNGVDCPRNTTENMNVTRVPCFGGYARILERASEIRAEVPNSLFLNAGDEFQGTLFYSYYGGEVISQVLNQGNFSAFTLGNHGQCGHALTARPPFLLTKMPPNQQSSMAETTCLQPSWRT